MELAGLCTSNKTFRTRLTSGLSYQTGVKGQPVLLNLFYAEPDPDRWLPFDRYPRKVVRRLVRGALNPGGHKRVFLNLCDGLWKIGVNYRLNDYAYARKNPSALACIIGKPFLLDVLEWKNPILFGAAIYSHPVDDPRLLERRRINKILVPGPWMEEMCRPDWGRVVTSWPVGIDTDLWRPSLRPKTHDVLLYDKVRWRHEYYEPALISPIRTTLRRQGRSFLEIRYGRYREEEFRSALAKCASMVFLCEHETQGIAYQQALACGVPIFAWDRGGAWQDPSYYPDKVVFQPVSSVPYWDERCGMKFQDFTGFERGWPEFWASVQRKAYYPRDYILENLTLEICAQRYAAHVRDAQ
jgi:glycosyltransferase involved in cell wall biosynthesis